MAEANTGTIILLLSGLVLYADKVINYFNLQTSYQFRYYGDLEVFVWSCATTLAPLMVIMGVVVHGKKWALGSPLSAYSVQAMYIMRDEHWIQRDYFWWHTLIFIICFVLFCYILQNYTTTIYKLKSKIRFIMDKMIVDSKPHVKDNEKWNTQIVEPTLNKLDE